MRTLQLPLPRVQELLDGKRNREIFVELYGVKQGEKIRIVPDLGRIGDIIVQVEAIKETWLAQVTEQEAIYLGAPHSGEEPTHWFGLFQMLSKRYHHLVGCYDVTILTFSKVWSR